MSTPLPGGGALFLIEQVEVIDRGAGIASVPLVGGEVGATNLSTGMTLIPPGGAIPFHTHNVEESVVLLEGIADVEVGGQTFRLNQYDTTYMPAGIPHRFKNVGDTTMRILWIYPSIQTSRTLLDSGQTMDHLGRYD
ncbi:MAG: cupin domain-containing protein [Dehalococcoidia bacterium]